MRMSVQRKTLDTAFGMAFTLFQANFQLLPDMHLSLNMQVLRKRLQHSVRLAGNGCPGLKCVMNEHIFMGRWQGVIFVCRLASHVRVEAMDDGICRLIRRERLPAICTPAN
jgi:hypothetical protein